MKITIAYLIDQYGRECIWCGREIWPVDCTIEHLCPRNKGGHKTMDNSVIACHSCNRQRKSKAAVSFARRREDEGLSPRWQLLQTKLDELTSSERKQHRQYGQQQQRHLPTLCAHSKAATAKSLNS